MIAVQVIPDRHDMDVGGVGSEVRAAASNGRFPHVRRPTNGIELKEETFATLRVVVGNGQNIPLIDGGSRMHMNDQGGNVVPMEVDGRRATDIYSNFLIQSVQEDRLEKQQIVETFGEAFIFFFGERPKMITVNGVLANTFDFNWEAEWWHNYDHYLRGTKCVENDARIFLMYDRTLVSGYIMSASTLKNSQDRNFVNFGFQMFVTGYTNLLRPGDPNANQSGVEPIESTDQLDWRPDLVEYSGQPYYSNPSAIGGDPSLYDAIVGGMQTAMGMVSSLRDTMAGLKSMAQNTLLSLDYLSGGSVVRVPKGFAGALVFDDPQVQPSGYWGISDGPIRFKTFSDKDEEYIGFSEHYGSSDLYLGRELSPDPYKYILDGWGIVVEAERQWMSYGFVLLDEQTEKRLGHILAINRKMGLADLGATRKLVAKAAKGLGAAMAAVDREAANVQGGLDAAISLSGIGNTVVDSVFGRSGLTPLVELSD